MFHSVPAGFCKQVGAGGRKGTVHRLYLGRFVPEVCSEVKWASHNLPSLSKLLSLNKQEKQQSHGLFSESGVPVESRCACLYKVGNPSMPATH